jgi:HK97 family phage major capsid protein
MTPVEEKIDAVAGAFEQFKTLHSKELAEAKKFGEASAETKEAVEKANKEIDRLSAEVKAMSAHMARTNQGGEQKGTLTPEQLEHKAQFNRYLRKGGNTDALCAAEQKAMSVQSDPDGGFMVTPELSNTIVEKVYESSPIRQLASQETISTDTLEIIEDLEEADAGWVTETQSRGETGTPKLKKIVIGVHEIYANPKVTQKLLDDARWNVETWLADKVSKKFARVENTAFMLGDGVNKPRGLFTYPDGDGFGMIEQFTTGAATGITADALINLFYALKEPYLVNASWLLKRQSVAAIRKLKDLQGQYLWAPGLTVGAPESLLGRPIYHAADLAGPNPSGGAFTTGNLIAAFGDIRETYQVVDRFGVRTLRDPFTAKPFVQFYTTKRVGGDVKNFESTKLLRVGT